MNGFKLKISPEKINEVEDHIFTLGFDSFNRKYKFLFFSPLSGLHCFIRDNECSKDDFLKSGFKEITLENFFSIPKQFYIDLIIKETGSFIHVKPVDYRKTK